MPLTKYTVLWLGHPSQLQEWKDSRSSPCLDVHLFVQLNYLQRCSMARRNLLLTLILLWCHSAYPVSGANSSFQDRCLSFTPEAYIYNSTRHVLEYAKAGTKLTFPDNDRSCNRSSQLVNVDLCRIGLSIPTSRRSSISFELWLPAEWSGRFLATGNGGIDGCG